MDRHPSASRRTRHLTVVIPAAGAGRRMGRPKWRVPWHGRIFLDWIRASLNKALAETAGIGSWDVRVTAAPAEAETLHRRYPEWAVIPLPENRDDQFASVQFGLLARPRRLKGRLGALLWPVDYPAVSPSVIRALVNAAKHDSTRRRCYFRPTYQRRSGHPILIPEPLLQVLAAETRRFPQGLRDFFRARRVRPRDVPVHDPSVLWNFNTPDHLLSWNPTWEPGTNSGV